MNLIGQTLNGFLEQGIAEEHIMVLMDGGLLFLRELSSYGKLKLSLILLKRHKYQQLIGLLPFKEVQKALRVSQVLQHLMLA